MGFLEHAAHLGQQRRLAWRRSGGADPVWLRRRPRLPTSPLLRHAKPPPADGSRTRATLAAEMLGPSLSHPLRTLPCVASR